MFVLLPHSYWNSVSYHSFRGHSQTQTDPRSFLCLLCIMLTSQRAQISCHNQWQEQLAQHWLYSRTPLFQFLWLLLFRSPFLPSGACTKKGDGTTMSLIFFKAAGLVNALIFMLHHWINDHCSVAPFKQTSAQLSHEPTFLFSLFLIFIRRVSLCAPRFAAQAGQRSRWSWQGFSVLLKDTLADWVLATVGLEPSYTALQPQHWQLIWISKRPCYTEYFYPGLLFSDCLKWERVINGFYLQKGNYNISICDLEITASVKYSHWSEWANYFKKISRKSNLTTIQLSMSLVVNFQNKMFASDGDRGETEGGFLCCHTLIHLWVIESHQGWGCGAPKRDLTASYL